MNKTRIYITDDHAILRDGLKLLLKNVVTYEVVGESKDGETTLKEIDTLKPDVLILDISLPTISGIDVCRQIRKQYPEIKIIILSRHDNEIYVKQLLKYGISGYVLKENAAEDLTRAINAAIDGNIYLSPKLIGKIVPDYSSIKGKQDPHYKNIKIDLLTDKEKTVLKLIAEGKSNKEIAQILYIESVTVKKHRANIMKKLEIHNIAGLVKFAIKNDLIEV